MWKGFIFRDKSIVLGNILIWISDIFVNIVVFKSNRFIFLYGKWWG